MKTISDISNDYYNQTVAVNTAWAEWRKNGNKSSEYSGPTVKYTEIEDMLFKFAKEKYPHFTDKQINEIESFCYEFYHANYSEYISQFGRMCDFIHGFLQIK